MAEIAHDSERGLLALRFARALGAGDFAAAHALLSAGAGRAMSEQELAARYAQMVSYGDGAADEFEVTVVDDDVRLALRVSDWGRP